MRRTILFALMIPLLLSGCAGQRQDENEWKTWQDALYRAVGFADDASGYHLMKWRNS